MTLMLLVLDSFSTFTAEIKEKEDIHQTEDTEEKQIYDVYDNSLNPKSNFPSQIDDNMPLSELPKEAIGKEASLVEALFFLAQTLHFLIVCHSGPSDLRSA